MTDLKVLDNITNVTTPLHNSLYFYYLKYLFKVVKCSILKIFIWPSKSKFFNYHERVEYHIISYILCFFNLYFKAMFI